MRRILALALAVWLRPLSVLEALGRRALGSAGLEKAQLGGLTVFRGGSGPTLVLLHGVNDQAGGWARLARPLVADRRQYLARHPVRRDLAARRPADDIADAL